MIIDDSVTIGPVTVTLSSAAKVSEVTEDCIDRQAAGTCFTHKPTFVLRMIEGLTGYTGGGAFTMMTGDTDDTSTHVPVMTVYIPGADTTDADAVSVLAPDKSIAAKMDLPIEHVKRYISFKLDTDANVGAGTYTFEVLTVMDAARGL